MKPPSRARATRTVCSVAWRLMAAQRAGIDVTGRQAENVRAQLKRLEHRGWLRRNAGREVHRRALTARCGPCLPGCPRRAIRPL